MKNSKKLLFAMASILSVVLVVGCSIHANKSGEGSESKKDVDIRTPFGSVTVHEGGSADTKDLGLPAYPAARVRKRSGDHDSNANVDVSSSMAGVKVVVREFETDDSPDKVLTFYQKPMEKFGKVIQCSGGSDFTFHHHKRKDDPVSCDGVGHEYDKEIKVGTENNQHVVAVKPNGKGSQFTLVYVRVWDNKDTI